MVASCVDLRDIQCIEVGSVFKHTKEGGVRVVLVKGKPQVMCERCDHEHSGVCQADLPQAVHAYEAERLAAKGSPVPSADVIQRSLSDPL